MAGADATEIIDFFSIFLAGDEAVEVFVKIDPASGFHFSRYIHVGIDIFFDQGFFFLRQFFFFDFLGCR